MLVIKKQLKLKLYVRKTREQEPYKNLRTLINKTTSIHTYTIKYDITDMKHNRMFFYFCPQSYTFNELETLGTDLNTVSRFVAIQKIYISILQSENVYKMLPTFNFETVFDVLH